MKCKYHGFIVQCCEYSVKLDQKTGYTNVLI